MVDKIAKAIAKLSKSEKQKIKQILELLTQGRLTGLDIKKLKDRSDLFRVRAGRVRIIYRNVKGKIFILSIARRNEKTYRDL